MLSLLVMMLPLQLKSQDFPTEISLQYGPETGLSHIFFPKISYRENGQGLYFGGFVSVNLVAVLAVSTGPLIGYRKKGLAAETSLSYTFTSGRGDGMTREESTSGHWLNLNPKVLLGYKRVFAGFGPSFYLIKPKKLTTTLWDDVGKYNFELGYSERGWEK
ncbi:MAG: hypothetical protein KA138_11760 [Saprospiraceae bacterium]|nr:hypothetical protein [Saprospiraceae bacterium]